MWGIKTQGNRADTFYLTETARDKKCKMMSRNRVHTTEISDRKKHKSRYNATTKVISEDKIESKIATYTFKNKTEGLEPC